jgi:hypothetical protein
MSIFRFWCRSLLVSAVPVGTSFLAATTGFATDVTPTAIDEREVTEKSAPHVVTQALPTNRNLHRINPVTELENPQASSNLKGQVTSVSQLSDVQPTDWAFQALQSLVERYGCIAGYPNGTFRGNRALSRYEFAAGLNACLSRIEELIASAVEPLALKEDLATLQKLQDEFAAELATLRGQVDALEVRTATLEAQQFSTTTKLSGEVLFALADVFGSDEALRSGQGARGVDGDADDDLDNTNTVFASRVRLNFDASFTGKDRLRVRLQAANIPNFNGVTGTDETRLGFDTNTGNAFVIDDLYYRFEVGANTRIQVAAAETEFNDFFNVFNPDLESSGSGTLSRFGRFSSIYRSASDAAGIGITHRLLDGTLVLNAGYLAPNAENPSEGNGLFNGNYGALAQIEFKPIKRLALGFTYARTFSTFDNVNLTGSLGSDRSQSPFDEAATSSNQFNVAANISVTPKFTISAWGTYVNAFGQGVDENGIDRDGDSADIWTWAIALSYKDLWREGSNLALVAGSPPGARSIEGGQDDPDTAYHVELLYRIPVTDNISITPGAFVVFNPESNSNNNTVYVGTIRTRFAF